MQRGTQGHLYCLEIDLAGLVPIGEDET